MSAPGPAEQVAFLQHLQRLLSDGSFVATYKFALLHALADLAVLHGDDSGAELTLSRRDIAAEIIKLYWRQAFPFRGGDEGGPHVLKQNTGRQAAILRKILEAQERGGPSLVGNRRRAEAWERLVREVGEIVWDDPRKRLQTVGSESLPFLYENVGAGSSITLRPGVAFCLRAFYPLVVDLVRGAWLRHVRARNAPLMGEGVDLAAFLFGTGRASLAAYQPILADVQSGACFYCRGALRGAGEVDHFIPWARFQMDLGHNFVLAHATCNRYKSDHLADERHLERWIGRNDVHASHLASAFDAAGLPYSAPTTLSIGQWAYEHTSRIRGPVWEERRHFHALAPGWESLFGTPSQGVAARV